MTAKKKNFNRSRGTCECDARTNDVFEAFQFPCDEGAGGPCYDKGSVTGKGGEENRTDGTRRRRKGDICLEKQIRSVTGQVVPARRTNLFRG